MKARSWWWLLACSCSSSGGGGDMPPDNTSIALSGLCTALARADCARLERCGHLLAPFDKDRCQVRQEGRCEPYRAAIERAVAGGEAQYFELSADRCRAQIGALSCEAGIDHRWFEESECRAMFIGTRAEGEGCSLPVSCTEGHFCDGRAACPGVCRRLRTNNETCSPLEPCAREFFCAAQGNRCRARVASGAPCEQSIAGNSCADTTFCDASQPGGATCAPVRGRGNGCQSVYECAPGLRCLNNICSAGQENDSCASTADCGGGLGCAGGRCKPVAVGSEACGPSVPCHEGFTCTSTCAERPVVSQACAVLEVPCYQSRCGMGTCLAPARDGEACGLDRDCLDGRSCSGQVCTLNVPSCSGT